MSPDSSFSCGDSLDITLAAALHSRLQMSLQKSSSIELQASSVRIADTAGLQLFVALNSEIRRTGGELIWVKPSRALVDAAALLGLENELGLVSGTNTK